MYDLYLQNMLTVVLVRRNMLTLQAESWRTKSKIDKLTPLPDADNRASTYRLTYFSQD
jgi:hypothetical protein